MIKRTVEEQILRSISFLESGRVFSSTDFADIANQNTIRTTLRRLTLAKKIDALGHSLYYRRIITKKYPIGYQPKYDSVANAIARRFSWKIFPTLSYTFAYFSLRKDGDRIFPSSGPNKKFEFNSFAFQGIVEFRHIPLKLSRIADKKGVYVCSGAHGFRGRFRRNEANICKNFHRGFANRRLKNSLCAVKNPECVFKRA